MVSPVALVAWCLDSLTAPGTGALGLDVDLSLLTVVVPSRNRQDYLLRQIRFWASSSASLIVVDGSIRPLDDRVRSAVDNHRRMTYLHEHSSFARRLNLAAALIETPYSVMLGDDEFHLPSGLGASLNVLEEHPDLVGCMGQVLSFSPVGPYRRIVFSRAYPQIHRYKIRHSRPADRLNAAMSTYSMASCYAVLRSAVWRKSWGATSDWGSGHATEIQQAMAVYLLGGLATTDHVQWLRSIENPTDHVSSEEKDRKVWFPEWWESRRYEAERAAFVSKLVEIVADELGADRDECASWVIAGAEVFVDENRSEYEFEEPVQGLLARLNPAVVKMLRTVARCFPDPMFLGAKRWRGRVLRFLGRSGGSYCGTVEDLPEILRAEGLVLPPGVVDEIATIEVMVREFHALRDQEVPGRQ